jgi:hypothetical protein
LADAGLTSTSAFPGAPQITLNPSAGFLTKFHPKLYTIDSTIFLGEIITSIAEFEPELALENCRAILTRAAMFTLRGRREHCGLFVEK